MKSFKEWNQLQQETVHVDHDTWGWEISGSLEEILAEVERNKMQYSGSGECILSIVKAGYVDPHRPQ